MKIDPLAALDAIPREHIPAAIARLAARAMTEPTPRSAFGSDGSARSQRCLSPSEVAVRLGVHRRWVYNHADDLGALRLSRRKLVVPEANVERYLDRHA